MSTDTTPARPHPGVMAVHPEQVRHLPALTKVLATLGPASDDEKTITRLVEAGASLFRLNFSHGVFEDHKRRVQLVRRVAYQLNTPLTVLGDLPGPKLRIGRVPGDGIVLEAGQEVAIRADIDESVPGARPTLASDFARIAQEVGVGQRVLINDGAIRMLVVGCGGDELVCRVTTGGLVTTRKGLNLPDSELSVPALTERDIEFVEWAVENDIDYLALSFVRRADEVRDLRARLKGLCADGRCGTALIDRDGEPTIPVVAKIETPQAVENYEEIIRETDAIMIARGDLGVEMDVAEVPMIQKRLIRAAHDRGVPCIVATQMLESMITQPNPTRAEISDVCNAILDGADCVMLSAETATGKYPVLAVETMQRVAIATERALRTEEQPPTVPAELSEGNKVIPALAHGAWHMARDTDAKAIVVWSQLGGGARFLSRHNFHIPILAFSSNEPAVRRMNLLFAVFPVLWIDVPTHRSEFAREADRMLVQERWVERGDAVVLLGGKPMDRPGSTNTVAIRVAGELNPGDPEHERDGDED